MRTTRVIPCLDVDRGRVVKGVNFVGLPRRRRSGRAGREVRPRGCGRGHLPRHHRVVRPARDDDRRRPPHCRDRLHPLHDRRWGAVGRRRAGTPPGRRGQGVGEHRGRRASRADHRDRHRVRSAVRRVRSRRSQSSRRHWRLGGVRARRTHGNRPRCDRVGRGSRPARCGRDHAHVDGSRRDARGLRPRAHSLGHRRRRRACDRERRSRHASITSSRGCSRAGPTRCSRPRSSTSASTPSQKPSRCSPLTASPFVRWRHERLAPRRRGCS